MQGVQLSFLEDDLCKREAKVLNNIYGRDYPIYPLIESKKETPTDRSKYLQCLLPLEMYHMVIITFSSGKDSLCSLLYALSLGIPKEKILLLHHDVDGYGTNPIFEMDWACTRNYAIAVAKHFGVKIRFSWREGGFAGELLRFGASKPVSFEEIDSGIVRTLKGANWDKSESIRTQIEYQESIGCYEEAEVLKTELKKYGYRMKFPAKSADLSVRWCSSALKIEVAEKMIRASVNTFSDCRILVIDGIRREESVARSKYNEIELHSANAPRRNRRIVHVWRNIVDWTEDMVWEMIERYRIRPNPVYYAGFGRCSCASCIFLQPSAWRAFQEIYPERFAKLVQLERRLGFTIDNKKDLISYVGNSKSCIPEDIDLNIIKMLRTGVVPDDYISLGRGDRWILPSGAYSGNENGPC